MLVFHFGRTGYNAHPPPSTMVSDLASYVGNSLLSDVTFVVEGIPIPAHKVILSALFTLSHGNALRFCVCDFLIFETY